MNLIVGGTGFVGGHLAEYFFKEGEISKGIFRKGSHLRILDQCGVQCIEADLLDKKSLHEPLDMVNVVYNLASPTPRGGDQEEEYTRVNSEGLRNLLDEAEEHGVQTFVHLSTLDVYGFGGDGKIGRDSIPAPAHPYQSAKLEAEGLLREFAGKKSEMKIKIVRAARAVGPREPTLVIPILRMIEEGKIVLPSGSDRVMSFTHPRDIAQAMLKTASQGENGRIYQVKSFDASGEQLVGSILETCGEKATIRREGLLSKSKLPSYSASQLKGGLMLEDMDSWRAIAYSPAYDMKKTASEITEWYGKEPWVTKNVQT